MKNKPTPKPHHQLKATPAAKKKNPLWVVILLMAIISTGSLFWWNYDNRKPTTQSTSTPSTTNAPANADQQQLIGRWARTDSDGAYVIEIKSAGTDGKLAAGYFNPNPIKVGRAEWQINNNNILVVVELRDLNYPGSTYTLNFFPAENRMTGNYYQAVEGVNYEVEFVRIR